jgi:alpha-glucosidase
VVNLGTTPVPLTGGYALTSGPVPDGTLPPETAAWFTPR